jgi:hypothetical protein
MQLSTTVATTALLLGMLLIAQYARGEGSAQPQPGMVTAQAKVEAREQQRRIALAEHRKRKEEFAKRCGSEPMSAAQLEQCRAAYRKL